MSPAHHRDRAHLAAASQMSADGQGVLGSFWGRFLVLATGAELLSASDITDCSGTRRSHLQVVNTKTPFRIQPGLKDTFSFLSKDDPLIDLSLTPLPVSVVFPAR